MLIDFNLWDFLPYLGLTIMGMWFLVSLLKAMYRAGQDEPIDQLERAGELHETPMHDWSYREAQEAVRRRKPS